MNIFGCVPEKYFIVSLMLKHVLNMISFTFHFINYYYLCFAYQWILCFCASSFITNSWILPIKIIIFHLASQSQYCDFSLQWKCKFMKSCSIYHVSHRTICFSIFFYEFITEFSTKQLKGILLYALPLSCPYSWEMLLFLLTKHFIAKTNHELNKQRIYSQEINYEMAGIHVGKCNNCVFIPLKTFPASITYIYFNRISTHRWTCFICF